MGPGLIVGAELSGFADGLGVSLVVARIYLFILIICFFFRLVCVWLLLVCFFFLLSFYGWQKLDDLPLGLFLSPTLSVNKRLID